MIKPLYLQSTEANHRFHDVARITVMFHQVVFYVLYIDLATLRIIFRFVLVVHLSAH